MTERTERALALHSKGYNCAQAVLCAYCDLFGLDEQTAYRMSEFLGLGMGSMEMCGALTGAMMLCGYQNSGGIEQAGKTKASTYALDRLLAEKFRQKNGTYLCREIKGIADGQIRRSCQGCVADACMLLEEQLAEQKDTQ